MTLLSTRFDSGAQFTTNLGPGSILGVSGINDITGRINFGGFDYPQSGTTYFTTNAALNIISGLVVGIDHSYAITGSYGADEQPVIVQFSGTTLGSTITWTYCYQTGSYGATATGSLISGTCVLT